MSSSSRDLASLLTPLTPSPRAQASSPAQRSHLLTCHQAWPPERRKVSPLLSSLRESRECPCWGLALWACPEELGNQSSCQNYLLEEENHLKALLCYFTEVAFIFILKVFIRKTTGAGRRLLRLEERRSVRSPLQPQLPPIKSLLFQRG